MFKPNQSPYTDHRSRTRGGGVGERTETEGRGEARMAMERHVMKQTWLFEGKEEGLVGSFMEVFQAFRIDRKSVV